MSDGANWRRFVFGPAPNQYVGNVPSMHMGHQRIHRDAEQLRSLLWRIELFDSHRSSSPFEIRIASYSPERFDCGKKATHAVVDGKLKREIVTGKREG
jgi:hypothetical protein